MASRLGWLAAPAAGPAPPCLAFRWRLRQVDLFIRRAGPPEWLVVCVVQGRASRASYYTAMLKPIINLYSRPDTGGSCMQGSAKDLHLHSLGCWRVIAPRRPEYQGRSDETYGQIVREIKRIVHFIHEEPPYCK